MVDTEILYFLEKVWLAPLCFLEKVRSTPWFADTEILYFLKKVRSRQIPPYSNSGVFSKNSCLRLQLPIGRGVLERMSVDGGRSQLTVCPSAPWQPAVQRNGYAAGDCASGRGDAILLFRFKGGYDLQKRLQYRPGFECFKLSFLIAIKIPLGILFRF